MPKILLTEKLIPKLICPADKRRIEYCDTRVRGMYYEVRATSPGQGTWYLRYKDPSGKTCHQKLGCTEPDDTGQLVIMRQRAKTLKAEIQLGRNPREEARLKKQDITWDAFFEQYYLPHAKSHKRSWKNDSDMHRLRISPLFGKTALKKLQRHSIQVFHNDLKESGLAAATADHYAKLMRQALNYAVEWDLLEKNPIAKFRLFNEDNQVERYLDDDELQRLLSVLQKDKNRTVAGVILLLLSTGVRRDEALNAKWADIDLANRILVIQATSSKSKRKRSLPLNDVALDVLENLSTKGKSPYLFTNSRTAERLKCISKPFRRILKSADLEDLRCHDLRHSFASFAINSGRSLYEVQQLLGHSDPKVTQRYAHLSSETLQDAASSASDRINAAIKANS